MAALSPNALSREGNPPGSSGDGAGARASSTRTQPAAGSQCRLRRARAASRSPSLTRWKPRNRPVAARNRPHSRSRQGVRIANKAVWRALKLQTLVWANMSDGRGPLCPGRPRVVVDRATAFPTDRAGSHLQAESGALRGGRHRRARLGRVACAGLRNRGRPVPDWKFQPQDFVASLGLHAALVVGEPRRIEGDDLATLAEQLAGMTIRLSKNGELAEEGAGRNALRSPALCLAELAAAIAAQPAAEPLRPGELVSTGSLPRPTCCPSRLENGGRSRRKAWSCRLSRSL